MPTATLGLGMLMGLAMRPGQSRLNDRRIVPPVVRSFHSPNRSRELRLSAKDGWKTRDCTAEAFANGKLVWRQILPHSHGPRDAAVLNDGRVVLLDEWINVASERAITVLDPKGRQVAVYGFDGVRRALGVDYPALDRGAIEGDYKAGTWLASRPRVWGRFVRVKAGGKSLIIDAASGQISVKAR